MTDPAPAGVILIAFENSITSFTSDSDAPLRCWLYILACVFTRGEVVAPRSWENGHFDYPGQLLISKILCATVVHYSLYSNYSQVATPPSK